MKKNIILVLLFCITITISAQTAIWQSANNVDIIGTAYVIDAVSDEMGNSYYTGFFYNTITLGEISLTSYGGSDIFIAKMDINNECEWAVKAGSTGGSSNIDGELWESGRRIKLDNSGNIVLVGSYAGAASFGSIQQPYRGGLCDAFVAKLNQSGEWLWAASGGSSSHDRGRDIDTDNNNNIFISGTIYANATFGSISVIRDSFDDGFVAKLDANGNWIWVRKPISVSSAHDDAGQVKVDYEGNLITTFGVQFGNYTFGSIVLPAIGTNDNVIAKIDTDGNWLWAHRYMNGTTNGVAFYDLTCNSNNDIYVAGLLQGTVSMGSTQLVSSGDEDILLIKIDSNGNLLWENSYGGVGPDRGMDIIIDNANNPCISGYFSNSLSFDDIQLNSSGGQDLFVLQVNPSGEVLSALSAGGTSDESSINLQVKDNASLTVWGTYLDSANFGITELSGSTSINNTFISTVTLVEPVEPTIVEQFDPIQMFQNSSITLDLTTYFADIYSDLTYTVVGNYAFILDIDTNNLLSIQSTTDWYGTEYITIRATNQWGLFVEQVLRVSVLQTFAVTENFDHSGSIPANWNVQNIGTTEFPWQPVLVNEENYVLRTKVTIGKTANERLISPNYNFSNYQDVQVSFDIDFLPYGSGSGVFAYTLNNITYTTIENFSSSTTGTKTYSIPELDSKSSVRFRWSYTNSAVNTGQDNYWTVDNFNISAMIKDTDSPEAITGLTLLEQSSDSATLSWNPSFDIYFDRYELYISSDEEVTTDDQLWSIIQDPLLLNVNSTQTNISPFEGGEYWIAIRAIDQSNNVTELSEPIFVAFDTTPPLFTEPLPSNQPEPMWAVSRTVLIGCEIFDDSGIDQSSIQYRFDTDGNGSYDESETWESLPNRANVRSRINTISVSLEITANIDGLIAFEFRASDMSGNIAHSGNSGEEGIEDDWIFRVDTTPPTAISNFFVQAVTANSIQLTWTASSDDNFAGYQINYTTNPEVSSSDPVWNATDDPTLAFSGDTVITTTITELTPSTRYYLMLRSVDEAGWEGQCQEVITAMTASSGIPATPQNLTISITGTQIILDWDEVTTDVNNNPIEVTRYNIFVGDHPDFVCNYDSLISTTTESTFILDGVIDSATMLFFKINTVSGAIRIRK